MGDYNLPGVDWDRNWSDKESERLVVETFADKFLTQLVRGATHIGGNTLDLGPKPQSWAWDQSGAGHLKCLSSAKNRKQNPSRDRSLLQPGFGTTGSKLS